MNQDLRIRTASEADAEAIVAIYNPYVLHSIITFETASVEVPEMRERIRGTLAKYDWMVAEVDSGIVAYAYYNSFRPRAAYNSTVESTVYVDEQCAGVGIGKKLYAALIQSAAGKGFREMIGVIALPNPASLALHRSLGFQEVGILHGVGHKFSQYVDVALWQKSLPG